MWLLSCLKVQSDEKERRTNEDEVGKRRPPPLRRPLPIPPCTVRCAAVGHPRSQLTLGMKQRERSKALAKRTGGFLLPSPVDGKFVGCSVFAG
jgi:hypothetical protein